MRKTLPQYGGARIPSQPITSLQNLGQSPESGSDAALRGLRIEPFAQVTPATLATVEIESFSEGRRIKCEAITSTEGNENGITRRQNQMTVKTVDTQNTVHC